MLKAAFNALIRLHSKTGTIKRLGTPDLYSPCRLTPSNYFRFLRGPEYTTIRGVEFIIPVDSLTGSYAQLLTFDKVPDFGVFKINLLGGTTDEFTYTSTASAIQIGLRLVPGLQDSVVTGNFSDGFLISFQGISTKPVLGTLIGSTLLNGVDIVEATFTNTSVAWDTLLKKGDRVMDGNRPLTVDELIEMHDLGADVMGYRVRCD